jgi:hypothetical protein
MKLQVMLRVNGFDTRSFEVDPTADPATVGHLIMQDVSCEIGARMEIDEFTREFFIGYRDEAARIARKDAGDITGETLDEMRGDCIRFVMSNRKSLDEVEDYMDSKELGRQFWLTRNGHGMGIWDREEVPVKERGWLLHRMETWGEYTIVEFLEGEDADEESTDGDSAGRSDNDDEGDD